MKTIKTIAWLVILGILFLSTFAVFGQPGSVTTNAVHSKVSDSTSVVEPSGYGTEWYSTQQNKWRISQNGVRYDLLGWLATQKYNGVSPTTVTVGGLNAGSSITNQTWIQIIQSIVAPYINPAFTSFSVSGQATMVEVGTTLSGSKTFTWSVNPNSGVVPTIDIFDNTASSTLLAGTPNDGTQAVTVTTIQLNSNGATQSWKGIANNTSPLGTVNSSNFVVTGRFIEFYGPSASTPTNSATVRALPSNGFYTTGNTFILNTGTSQTKFDVALPPGASITQVVDLDALGAIITSQYVNTSTIGVLDAGGTSRSYTLYEMNVGSPYSTSHRHQITTN